MDEDFDPRREPAAPEIRRQGARVRTSDGLELHVRSWLPSSPRAAISVVHGLAEHAQRYGGLAVRLAQRGFAVHAVDCRGHGLSPGPRVHVDSFDEFVADADALRAHTRAAHPGLPHVLVGHSQGGLISILSVARHPAGVDRVMLSSPFLAMHPGLRPNPVLALGVKVLLRIAPRKPLPFGAPPQFISRARSVVKHYTEDPLVKASNRVSTGWYRAQAEAQARAAEAAASWRLPTLLMAAEKDLLADFDVTDAWVRRTPAGVVRYVPWPGLYHEIFNEPEREQVYAELFSWLDAPAG